jgi:hypothetical protein
VRISIAIYTASRQLPLANSVSMTTHCIFLLP